MAGAVGVCPRTVRKWVGRYRQEALAGLADRSSRPKQLRRATPEATVERIEALRRQRLTGKAIAIEKRHVGVATISRHLDRRARSRVGIDDALYAYSPSQKFGRYCQSGEDAAA